MNLYYKCLKTSVPEPEIGKSAFIKGNTYFGYIGSSRFTTKSDENGCFNGWAAEFFEEVGSYEDSLPFILVQIREEIFGNDELF